MTTTRLTSDSIHEMVVHSALPPLLEAAVAEVLGAGHVVHGDGDVMGAAEAAARSCG
jgi:hypothetical protein